MRLRTAQTSNAFFLGSWARFFHGLVWTTNQRGTR
jgi:hypothetical protein